MTGYPQATVVLVPLLGALHLRMPRYNVESVRQALHAFAPDLVALAPLPPGALDGPGWQACEDVALPHTVVPWAVRAGVRLLEVGEAPADPAAEADFLRYLEDQAQGRALVDQVRAALRPVHALLAEPLGADEVQGALLPALRAYQEAREQAFGEGPGTGWQRTRSRRLAERIVERSADLGAQRVAVVAGLDDVPLLAEALAGAARLEPLPSLPPDDAAQRRALLDFAMIGETDDPAALRARLRQVDLPEARYHEANLLLRHAHLAEALELLEAASHTDFQHPYYLPGFLLSRLGQLYDLAGQRDAAVRCYRGVRALSFAPAEAAAAAEAGVLEPFTLPAPAAS